MRAQHRFGGMLDESKHEGGIQDERNFNGRMRIKILWWEWDLLILTNGMQDGFKMACTTGGRMKKGNSQVTNVMGRTTSLTRRDRDKYSDWGGMAGRWEQNKNSSAHNAGLKKTCIKPSII